MRVLVFEHICGGGMVAEPLPAELVEQGGGMWRAAIRSLLDAGHRVVTIRDPRVALNVSHTFLEEHVAPSTASFAPARNEVIQLAMCCDVVLVIAPETDGLLVGWLKCFAEHDIATLNASVAAASLCGDKWPLAEHFRRTGVPTPPTVLLDTGAFDSPTLGFEDTSEIAEVTVKPRLGVGCEGIWRGPLDQLVAQAKVKSTTSAEPTATPTQIVQPWIRGRAVSVAAILSRPSQCGPHGRDQGTNEPWTASRILPPVGQRIGRVGNGRLEYGGGAFPIDDDLAIRAARLAERSLRTVPGLRGYVGVDLVLAHEPSGDVVIEINPRLTVSFAGYLDAGLPLGDWLTSPHVGNEFVEAPDVPTVAFDAAGRQPQESQA